MSWLWRRARRDRAEADLTEELRFHLNEEVRLREDRGLPPDEARRVAYRDFGNVTLVADATRRSWGWKPMTLLDDLKHASRRLRSRPGMALGAAAMLAIGVGLATGMFTVVDALILHPAPFKDPGRLASVMALTGHTGHLVGAPAVLVAWRTTPAFAGAEGVRTETSIVDTGAGAIVKASARVSTGMFTLLGVKPTHGRGFAPDEGRAGTDDRALLSEDLWRSAFGADPGLIGRRITIDGTPVLVVGLMPAGFRFPEWNTVIWQPIDFSAPPPGFAGESPQPFVRLAPGVPYDAAQKVALDVARPLDPSIQPTTQMVMTAMSDAGIDPYYQHAVPLLGAGVVLVFLVLCANVASLLLARLTTRQQEFRMCSALGASRLRLLRQAVIEHGLIGIGGIGAGIVLAWALVSLSRGLLPAAFLVRTLHPVALDLRALGVTTVAALLATGIAGFLPAWIGTRPSPTASLSAAGRAGTESRSARTLTRALLVGEIALACTLLAGASLLVRSFINIASVDRGLQTDGVLTGNIYLPAKAFPDRPARLAITATLEDGLRSLPGVERIALSGGLPPGGGAHFFWSDWQGDQPGAPKLDLSVTGYTVGSDFFGLYGIPLLRGRTFQPGDDPDAVIVGERLAALLFPGLDPIGHTFHFGKTRNVVVGLTREIRFPSLQAGRDVPEFYRPFQVGGGIVSVNIRCQVRCPDEAVVRRKVLALVPGATIARLGILGDQYREELDRPRGAAALGSTFALIAVLAAAGGLFSVLTYAVGRRRREFGIRTALGATPRQIQRLVIGDGAVVAAFGVGIGVAAAAASARVIASVEYGVTGLDPVTWTFVLGLLAVTTLLASWRPARRASRVDPVALLRDE